MQITIDHIRRAAKNTPNAANAGAVLDALANYGDRFGLNQPHRIAHFLAQTMHESLDFKYDREIWGPTPAQRRYEGRKDLGNTQPGDGKRFAGRAGIQITGRSNYAQFRDWCRRYIDPGAPDFEAEPNLVNTAPWEGLAPIWYWSTRNLNAYADRNDLELITVRINGGRNGLADRLDRYTRVALVVLDFGPTAVREFQASNGGLEVDGDPGQRTRAALHLALVALTSKSARAPEVAAASVVETKTIAPEALDKPVAQTSGFWERIGTIGTGAVSLGAAVLGDWRVAAVAAGTIIVIGAIGLVFHARIVSAVRAIKVGLQS